MPLKAKLTKDEFESLSEALQENYTEQGDSYVLQVDGFTDPRLNEFRENNRTLNKQMAELKKQLEPFADVDVEEYRELKKKANDPPPPAKPATPDPEVIRAAVEKATKQVSDRLKTIEDERDRLARERENSLFESQIDEVALKSGVQNEYLEDVRGRARKAGFALVEGEVRARRGEDQIYMEDGRELTPDAFVKTLPDGFFGRTAGAKEPGGSGSQPRGGKGRTLVSPDAVTFGQNLEDIAKGKVNVTVQ